MSLSFCDAVRFLEAYIPKPSKKHPGELGLRRMEYLVQFLGNPHLKYPTIHVGGTSGKGSTATMITSILGTKYKVGLYTSPHLVSVTERIKIIDKIKYQRLLPRSTSTADKRQAGNIKNTYGKSKGDKDDIPEEDFVRLLDKIRLIIRKVEESELGRPSYFEIAAALAFLYFAKKKVDIAVVEVGMGGRHDATNVVKPVIAVVTNIGFDHTDVLGNTLEEIVQDKVGIIKENIQVVSGVRQRSLTKIIQEKCSREKALLSLLGRDFHYRVKKITKEGSVFDYLGDNVYEGLGLSLLGEHQAENASLAIRAIELLGNLAIKQCDNAAISKSDIERGLRGVFIPGRVEIVGRNPLVILDGAHNRDKIKALVEVVKAIFPQKSITSVLAIKKGKDAKIMISSLINICQKIILTKFRLTTDLGDTYSYDPKHLLRIIKSIDPEKEVRIVNNSTEALQTAISLVKKEDLILATGSLYLIGEIKKSKIKYQK